MSICWQVNRLLVTAFLVALLVCFNFCRALKTEITQLRQQSAIRVGTEQKGKQCIRCHKELGILFNKGEICVKCKHLICLNCRVTVTGSTSYSWLCSLCNKQRYQYSIFVTFLHSSGIVFSAKLYF